MKALIQWPRIRLRRSRVRPLRRRLHISSTSETVVCDIQGIRLLVPHNADRQACVRRIWLSMTHVSLDRRAAKFMGQTLSRHLRAAIS